MRTFKHIFITLVFLVIFILLFRGWLYRQIVCYKTTGERKSYVIKDAALSGSIDKRSEDNITKIKPLIKLSLNITSCDLSYAFAKNQNDPNKLVESKTAHCVGYASYQASVLNYLFRKKEISNWKAKPLAGQLYVCGINIHRFFSSPFFRDHDFVEIKNSVTGECFYTDPTLHDYLNINFITHKR